MALCSGLSVRLFLVHAAKASCMYRAELDPCIGKLLRIVWGELSEVGIHIIRFHPPPHPVAQNHFDPPLRGRDKQGREQISLLTVPIPTQKASASSLPLPSLPHPALIDAIATGPTALEPAIEPTIEPAPRRALAIANRHIHIQIQSSVFCARPTTDTNSQPNSSSTSDQIAHSIRVYFRSQLSKQ
jgi:hypothetical protein